MHFQVFRTVVKLHLEYLYLVLHFDRFGACISQLDKLMTNVNDVSFYFHSVKFPVISIGVCYNYSTRHGKFNEKKPFVYLCECTLSSHNFLHVPLIKIDLSLTKFTCCHISSLFAFCQTVTHVTDTHTRQVKF